MMMMMMILTPEIIDMVLQSFGIITYTCDNDRLWKLRTVNSSTVGWVSYMIDTHNTATDHDDDDDDIYTG